MGTLYLAGFWTRIDPTRRLVWDSFVKFRYRIHFGARTGTEIRLANARIPPILLATNRVSHQSRGRIQPAELAEP